MPFLLRKIRKNRWYKPDPASWLGLNDLPADPLADLCTSQNTLSVWEIDDAQTNLELVVTALAATCDNLSNLDYALFNRDLVLSLNIEAKPVSGNSPFVDANRWHRDLVELSASKLVGLAKAIYSEAVKNRLPESKIRELIKAAVDARRIDATELKPGIAKKIGA